METRRIFPASSMLVLLACAMVLQVMIFLGCRAEPSAPAEATAPSVAPAPSAPPAPPEPSAQAAQEPRLSWREQEHRDSMQLAALIASVLDMARDSNASHNFSMSHTEEDDDHIPRSVSGHWDHHFTPERRHLIVQAQDPNTLATEIYIRERNHFRKLLSHRQWQLGHQSDSIWDVNGDGRLDFVVNWYAINGCCLKGFSDVYLQGPGGKSFSDSYSLINPTFSPSEHVVRGICYGHIQYTSLYKFRWNGMQLDTVEYVAYERDSANELTGNVLISKDKAATRAVRKVREVPKEYRGINDFDWFSGE